VCVEVSPRTACCCQKSKFVMQSFQTSQAGVPVDATDHKGLTPLMMACMFGRSLMAAYLLGRGARPNLTDMNGDSALHWAAYKGYPSLMQMLIYSGFDPQKPDNFGSSPLHLACISGNLMAVKLLCAKVLFFDCGIKLNPTYISIIL
jgi:ankyrin repeat protein